MNQDELAKRLETFARELEEWLESDWSSRSIDSSQYHNLLSRVLAYRDAARIIRQETRTHEDDRREARALVRTS